MLCPPCKCVRVRVGFCSPEIIQNLAYGEKADVWSLGCLLYQMCTLNPPFFSSNMLTLATKVFHSSCLSLSVSLYVCLSVCALVCVIVVIA